MASTTLAALVGGDPNLRLTCAVDRTDRPWPGRSRGGGRSRGEPPEEDAERAVTGLVRAYRLLLDRHGVLLPPAPRFEIGPDGSATGRVVLPDIDATPATPTTARETLASVTETAGRLAPEAAQRVLAAELRHLSPATAALLGPAAHTVTPHQHRVLTEVLRRVTERARQRRTDPTRKRPAVMLDIDLCALDPSARARTALTALGVAPDGPLPSYHPPAWELWTGRTGLNPDYDRFYSEFFTPWERLRDDVPAPGLARFVWEVYDAGGLVVFNTGRRERVRAHTEHALARAGVVNARIAMLPDDRTRPVHELKSENLRDFADLDVVAVFDDLCENRQAMAKELPDALFVGVALPGWVCEEPYDGAEVVATFETVPRTGRTWNGPARPALSDTRSLAELPLADLDPVDEAARRAAGHAVTLDEAATAALVRALLDDAERSAPRTAAGAPPGGPAERIHHLLTRERFLKGSRANFPPQAAKREMRAHLADGAPISVVTFGFPVKLHDNRLKAVGPLPDLAELGAFVRLRELHRTVQQVYPPGIAVTVLTDGTHFTDRPADRVSAYHAKLTEYRDLVGGAEFLRLADLDQVVAERHGPGVTARHTGLVDGSIAALEDALTGLDITADPVGALEAADVRSAASLGTRGDGNAMPPFRNLFWSLVYTVPIDPPPGVDRARFAQLVLADLFTLADPATPPEVVEGRRATLALGWERTVRYLAVLCADRDLGYDDSVLFPGRIRLTPNPRPGSLGFAYLGGAAVLPWHGTAALDAHGRLSVDFAVSLYDHGFVPVHSPLLGPDQPWTMAPATAVLPDAPERLDPAFLARVKLRRR